MGDTGGAGARVGIVANMTKRAARREPEPEAVERAPEPPDRPTSHAQWDETKACWVEW